MKKERWSTRPARRMSSPRLRNQKRPGQAAGQQDQDTAQEEDGPEEGDGQDAEGAEGPVNDQQGQVRFQQNFAQTKEDCFQSSISCNPLPEPGLDNIVRLKANFNFASTHTTSCSNKETGLVRFFRLGSRNSSMVPSELRDLVFLRAVAEHFGT